MAPGCRPPSPQDTGQHCWGPPTKMAAGYRPTWLQGTGQQGCRTEANMAGGHRPAWLQNTHQHGDTGQHLLCCIPIPDPVPPTMCSYRHHPCHVRGCVSSLCVRKYLFPHLPQAMYLATSQPDDVSTQVQAPPYVLLYLLCILCSCLL